MCGVWQKEKHSCRIRREKMYKGSGGEMYLPALCRPSSGHLLPYIKGFALISMPLHSSDGVCLVFSFIQALVFKRVLSYILRGCDALVFVQPSVCVCVPVGVWPCQFCVILWDLFGHNYTGALRVSWWMPEGGQVEGLRGITRDTDQEGFPLRLDPDYGLTCERMAPWGCSGQILMTAKTKRSPSMPNMVKIKETR